MTMVDPRRSSPLITLEDKGDRGLMPNSEDDSSSSDTCYSPPALALTLEGHHCCMDLHCEKRRCQRGRARRRRWKHTSLLLLLLAFLTPTPPLGPISSIRFAKADQVDDVNDQDDYAAANNDDAAVALADDATNEGKGDDDVAKWQEENMAFGGISVMAVSCIHYNNGHMIKYELFDNEMSYQCHFKNLGTFVVSIAHYMRAYFNYQAIINGDSFTLPFHAGYLNCIMLQETAYSQNPLYAKIGCMERETFTSTKLQIYVYEDAQCSKPYYDGWSDKKHATTGYNINGYLFSSKVEFRPPFYTCETCTPASIAESFTKQSSSWYDDEVMTKNEQNQAGDDADDADDDDDLFDDDDVDDGDDLFDDDDQNGDDADDGNADDGDDGGGDDGNDDGNKAWYYNGNGNNNRRDDDDPYYAFDDDGRRLATRTLTAATGQLEAYHKQFWKEIEHIRRSLDQNDDGVSGWNMCERIYKYGVWCDDQCRALDTFRVDEWSKPDIFLLALMCAFMSAMMLLVFAKRLKAAERARMYGDESEDSSPGFPPICMALVFLAIIGIITLLAKLKFVNETLVFAVVTCVLLFIYMLKLTLFETKRAQLLPPAHLAGRGHRNRRLFD